MEIIGNFIGNLTPNGIWLIHILDLVIVYILIYKLLSWISDTQAEYLVRGLMMVFTLSFLSQFLGFTTVTWLITKFETVLIFLIIIIFQPELRRFLERVGSGNMFSSSLLQADGKSTLIIHQLLKAVDLLSNQKIGALIVIEVNSNLTGYIESGIPVQSLITSEMLTSLFWPGSPTHDGAIIIQNNKIAAAGCLLPLTDTRLPDKRLGTRHRAALALSENSDALIIVISEETGVISLAENGNITRFLTKESLETRLFNLYKEEKKKKRPQPTASVLKRFFKL